MKQTKKVFEADVPQNITEKKMIPCNKLHFITHKRILERLSGSYEEYGGFLGYTPRNYYSQRQRRSPKLFSIKGAKDLLSIITKLFKPHYPQNAQQLKLDFSPSDDSKGINDKGLQALGLQLAQKFPKLRTLGVCFQKNKRFTHHGLEMFTFSISRNLNSLKTLSLDFTSCNKIPNRFDKKELKVLGSNLFKGPVSLRNLSFDFGGCEDICDESIIPFAKGIKRSLIKVQRLNLNFNDCIRLQEESISEYSYEGGFETLGEAIAVGLSDLKCLTICFGLNLEYPSYDYCDNRRDKKDYDDSDDSDDSDNSDSSIDSMAWIDRDPNGYAKYRIERSNKFYLIDKKKRKRND